MELPTRQHCLGRTPLGRGHRSRISQSPSHLPPLSLKLPERPIQLGNARIKSLPDGPALRRQRRRLGNAGRKCSPRRRRNQLHNRRRATPHNPQRRIPPSPPRHPLPPTFPELKRSGWPLLRPPFRPQLSRDACALTTGGAPLLARFREGALLSCLHPGPYAADGRIFSFSTEKAGNTGKLGGTLPPPLKSVKLMIISRLVVHNTKDWT